MSNYMSYGDVARALDVTLARAKGKMEGLEPDLLAANGRVRLFLESSVKKHLFEQNKVLITFLGYLSLEESYDVSVQKGQLDAPSV